MATRRLRPAEDLITPDINTTLNTLTLTDRDQATAKLARMHAAAIDNAALLAAALDEIDTDDEDLQARVRTLEAQVQAQTILATQGPKLLACLVELGATPKTRGAHKNGEVTTGGRGLANLRQARAG